MDQPRTTRSDWTRPRNRSREISRDGPSRGRNPRTTPVRGIGLESSRLVWSAADVYCGRRQSADSRPRGRFLMGQTADHGRGLEPSAVDAKTSSPICLSGQTRVCRVDPVRVLSYYKYILDLILDHILFSLKNTLIFWRKFESLVI